LKISTKYFNQKSAIFSLGLAVFLIILSLLTYIKLGVFEFSLESISFKYKLYLPNSQRRKFSVLNAYALQHLGLVFIFNHFEQFRNVLVKCFFMILKALAVVSPFVFSGALIYWPEIPNWVLILFGVTYPLILLLLYFLSRVVSKIREFDPILTKTGEQMIRYTPVWVYGFVY